MDKLKAILGQLAGYTSLCWKPKPKGVFDTTEAQKAVAQAHHQIEKLILGEEEIEEIIKNYFGYKNIAEPVYNMGFGCSLAHALYEAQKEKVNEEYRRVIKDPNKSGNY